MEMATIVLRKRDLNCKGNGIEVHRRVRLPDGLTGWASDIAEDITGSWSSGTFLAADRHAIQRGVVPVGTVVLAFERSLRGGQKSGAASVAAGRVGLDNDGKTKIEWGLSTRKRGQEQQVKIGEEWIAV